MTQALRALARALIDKLGNRPWKPSAPNVKPCRPMLDNGDRFGGWARARSTNPPRDFEDFEPSLGDELGRDVDQHGALDRQK